MKYNNEVVLRIGFSMKEREQAEQIFCSVAQSQGFKIQKLVGQEHDRQIDCRQDQFKAIIDRVYQIIRARRSLANGA